MELIIKTFLIGIVSSASGYQTHYEVNVEDIILTYVDKQYVDTTVHIYPINATLNGVNKTTMWKIDPPDNTRMTIKCWLMIKNKHKFNIFQFERPLRNMLEMEGFGVQKLSIECTRPPAVWPLKKNVKMVVYRTTAFYIDSSSFPPNLPEGNWSMEETVSLPNKTILWTEVWYFRVQSNK